MRINFVKQDVMGTLTLERGSSIKGNLLGKKSIADFEYTNFETTLRLFLAVVNCLLLGET